MPSVADDIFLHCRVRGTARVETERCIFRKALECIYLVDYGVYDLHWPTEGFYRVFDYGKVLYVPEVGPVYVYERMLVSAGDPPGIGVGERFTSLKATGTPAR